MRMSSVFGLLGKIIEHPLAVDFFSRGSNLLDELSGRRAKTDWFQCRRSENAVSVRANLRELEGRKSQRRLPTWAPYSSLTRKTCVFQFRSSEGASLFRPTTLGCRGGSTDTFSPNAVKGNDHAAATAGSARNAY